MSILFWPLLTLVILLKYLVRPVYSRMFLKASFISALPVAEHNIHRQTLAKVEWKFTIF